MEQLNCPHCGEELDFLDYIVKKSTGRTEYRLYICHSDECVDENTIYNDRHRGRLEIGDPSGCY